MTEEEAAKGGLWVIGDHPYSDHPDYPGRINGSFLVKSWVAEPDKYGPGKYSPRDRSSDGHWEYVRVLHGCLECDVHYSDGSYGPPGYDRRFLLAYPDEGVDIPPTESRAWVLPEHSQSASGITICRQLPVRCHFIKAGYGPGYELAYWDDNAPLARRIIPTEPQNLIHWRYQYLEVTEGMVYFTRQQEEDWSVQYLLKASEHVFLPNDGKTGWHYGQASQVLTGRGVTIFF